MGPITAGFKRALGGLGRILRGSAPGHAEAQACEARLRCVLDTIKDGIILMDGAGHLQAMNPAALEMFDHDWASLKGQSVRVLMPTQHTQDIASPGPEAMGRRKDGSVFPMELVVREALVNGQRLLTWMVRDVTIRKKSQDMLDYFSAIVNSSSDAIMSKDLNGIVTSWNPAAEKMFGYTDREMLGQSVDRLSPMEALSVEFDAMARIMRGDSVGYFETSRIKKNGNYFPVSCTMSPLRNAEGQIIGAATIIRDITDIKRQQSALKNSEETMRAAMEHAPIGMALVSPGGRWLRVNQALCDLLGYDREMLQLNDFQSITHPDDLVREHALIGQALDGEIRKYQIEKRFFHSSGRVVWVQVNMSLVLQDNAILPYFIAQITDITTRLEMERMKSEFISIVSHELRTPLTSIRGSLGLIKGAMSEEVSARAARLIDIAHSNCERLIVLINDILDIDKMASGQMRFEKTEAPLAPIVAQAVEGIQAYADQFGVQLCIRRTDTSLAAVVDVGRLMQVLANFLSNAVKFSPRGGTVDIVLTQWQGMARIAVTDHGPGIAEEFKARIFGKFMQADSTVTRAKGGTGLGLHIGKQIIEHMGGQVGFASMLGEGATFWMTLPCSALTAFQAEPIRLADAVHQPSQAHGLPRILHVEDDEDFALVVAEALRGRAEIVRAASLRQADHLLHSQTFELVVLDIGMPDGSGLRLLDDAAELAGHALPIIILSVADVPDHVRSRVHAVLVKSRVSELAVAESILQAVETFENAGHLTL